MEDKKSCNNCKCYTVCKTVSLFWESLDSLNPHSHHDESGSVFECVANTCENHIQDED